MSLARSIVTNILYAVIGRGLFRLLASIAMIYALRYFGPERYGILETALAWSNALITLSDVGLSTLMVREASRNQNEAAVYYGNTLIVQTVMTVILLLLLITIGFGFSYDPLIIWMIAIIGAGGLIFEFRKIMQGVLRVMLKQKFITAVEVANSVVLFIGIVCIFQFVENKNAALIAFGVAQLIVNVVSIIAFQLYTTVFVRPLFDVNRIPSMLKESWIFTLYNVFFMLYFQVNQIALSLLASTTEVGVYGAPSKVAVVLLFIPLMVYQVVQPLLFRYAATDRKAYSRLTQLIYRFFAAIGIPAGLGLALTAPVLVPFVFGSAYNASIPVMVWMGIFLMVRFFSAAISEMLTTSDKQKTLAMIQVGVVLLLIVLNLLLIPRYGAVGPAIAAVIAESVACILYVYTTRTLSDRTWKSIALPLIPIGIASLCMAAIISFTLYEYHILVTMILAALGYGVVLTLLRFFTPEDKALFTKALKKTTA